MGGEIILGRTKTTKSSIGLATLIARVRAKLKIVSFMDEFGEIGMLSISRNKLRYKSQDSRRRSSVDRIQQELDEFKVEIEQRFAKSKFNQNYTFPRVSDKPLQEFNHAENHQPHDIEILRASNLMK